MIRDITIGQYYARESVIHRLDPRLKIVATMVFIISMFCFHRFVGLALCTIWLIGVIWISKIPFKFMVKGLKPLAMILLFTMTVHILFTDGTRLVSIGMITISYEGIHEAIYMASRLCLLFFGASLMTFTTTPNHLTDGLERLFHPLNKVKVPVHEISMMMSIALRFIPILLEETDRIMKAQMARGADFETGGLIKRAKALIPILIPLFVSAFRRANDLAFAMEARCYRGGQGRTKMKPLSYSGRDLIGYMLLVGYLVGLYFSIKYIPTVWKYVSYPG